MEYGNMAEKEKELYAKLVEKTRDGRLKWKMHDARAYFVDIESNCDGPETTYHVCVSANQRSIIPASTVTLRRDDEYLTGFVTPGTELFYLAEASCEQRQRILEEVMADLEAL